MLWLLEKKQKSDMTFTDTASLFKLSERHGPINYVYADTGILATTINNCGLLTFWLRFRLCLMSAVVENKSEHSEVTVEKGYKCL